MKRTLKKQKSQSRVHKKNLHKRLKTMGKRKLHKRPKSMRKRKSMKRTAAGLPKIDKGPDKRPNSCQTYVPFCESQKLLKEENMGRPCNEFFFKDNDIYRPCRHGRVGNKTQCRNKGDLTKIQCSNQAHAKETADRHRQADDDEREQRRQERLSYARARQELASMAEYEADQGYFRSHPTIRLKTKKSSNASNASKSSVSHKPSSSSNAYNYDTTDYNTTSPHMRTGWASDY